MFSRHDDIYDLRADAINVEKQNANQVMSIGNILNDSVDQDFFSQNRQN